MSQHCFTALKAKFSGPYTVVRQASDLNYIIATPNSVSCEFVKTFLRTSDSGERGKWEWYG